MAAGTYNITIEQGATYSMSLTCYSDEAQTTPRDLSGYTARMHVRENKNDAATIIELATGGSGITISGDNSNVITVLMTAAQTSAFNFVKAYYDLEIVTGATVERLIEGTVALSEEVTR